MFGMGMPEIIMILVVALIVIGPRKLPDLGRSMGKALREFKKATGEFKSSLNIDDDDLGKVRRSFSDLNADLKSSLSAAAFGDKPGGTTPGSPPPATGAGAQPAADNAAMSDRVEEAGTPEAAGSDPAPSPGQERGDAGS